MNGLRFGTLLCLGVVLLPAQELRDYERKVSEFTLANGLHFIVLERHQVPVVSFHTYVNAGSAMDPAGRTGLANLLSRLAFDGTEAIGTKNWPVEKKALEDVEAAFDRDSEERNKGSKDNAGVLASMSAGLLTALTAAYSQQNPGEFMRAMQENGGVGIGSHTTPDSIETSYSLPSNRIELWFLLESQRLSHPVFRDFYRERQKLAADSAASKPLAKLRESLLATAFEDLPYRNPPLGWPGDVATLRTADAKAFLDSYCGPGNTVISIVGDVDPANAQQMAERYFGPIPARAHPPAMHTQESPQYGPKTVALWADVQPLLMIGYRRPPETNRDDTALDALSQILGDSRTGWLHRELVEEKQIAQAVEVISSYPSARYANLFVVSVTPAKDRTVEENRKAVEEMVTRLQSKPVDVETLTRVKNMLHGRFARLLGSNRTLAAILPAFYATYGDWRRLFAVPTEYEHLTAEDLQRVAAQYLIPTGQTVAYVTAPPGPGNPVSNPRELQ